MDLKKYKTVVQVASEIEKARNAKAEKWTGTANLKGSLLSAWQSGYIDGMFAALVVCNKLLIKYLDGSPDDDHSTD